MFKLSAILDLILLTTVVGAILYLLSCVDPNNKGILGILRRLLLEKVPRHFKAIGTRICGPWFGPALDNCFGYIFKTNNPIVMILYLIIGPGGYSLYVRYGYSDVKIVDYTTTINLYASLMVAAAAFYSYYQAVNVDPGKITPYSVSHYLEKYYQYDGLIFKKGQECSTCKLPKPARSKHSKTTDQCVARFDHYCIWIKGDVGEGNYKYFVSFIVLHAVLTGYGVLYGAIILSGVLHKDKLWGSQYLNIESGEMRTFGWGMAFQHLLNRFTVFSFMVVLCAIMFVALSCFACYHFWLIKEGVTTNEKIKKSVLEEDIKKVLNHVSHKRRMAEMDYESPQSQQQLDILDQQLEEIRRDLHTVRTLNYSRGDFLSNLKAIFKS